jgi:hypothetical protein
VQGCPVGLAGMSSLRYFVGALHQGQIRKTEEIMDGKDL